MSLVLLAHACSHLQNASLARLGLTSLPRTNQLHHLLLQLQKHGYVNTVALSGPVPPAPSPLSPILSLHTGDDDEVGLSGHVTGPFDPRIRGDPNENYLPDADNDDTDAGDQKQIQKQRHSESIVTQENVSTRRLWVGLKYHNSRPVLSKMGLISKPTRRIWMNVRDLDGLVHGERRGYVSGLRGIGETIFVTTDRGLLGIHECVDRKVGGMLLCRVNGL